jgi:hypothetical protein
MAAVDWDMHSSSCCFVSGYLDKYVEVMCGAHHHVVFTFVLLLHEARLATKQQFIFWKISIISSYQVPFCKVRSK